MTSLKQGITAKVLISYLMLLVLAIVVGWIIYAEINSFARAQEDKGIENKKVFRIGGLLTLMYETESFARSAIQSNRNAPYETYLRKNDSINMAIDSLILIMDNDTQRMLLDSVKILLEQKVTNISELRQIRNDKGSDMALNKAIEKFSNIEQTLGRLSLEDFVVNPRELTQERRAQLQEQINILNNYIPRDSTNTVDEAILDSLVIASRAMLEQIRKETAQRKLSVAIKENSLLQNDLNTSQQLREILSTLEGELLENAQRTNTRREAVLNRSIRVLTWAAIIGIALVILFSLLILNDFLKSQKYREQLEKANDYAQKLLKGREQLISMVSHDLRTPLNTILGYTELMAENTKSPREAYYAGRIKTASNYVTKLVDDLLDYTKLEAGKVAIETVPFDLKKLIFETAESLKAIYHHKPIALNYNFEDKLPGQLISDPHRVKQILNNLIGNAYKFTETGAITITVSYRHPMKSLEIDVTDTGIGIPEEKQPMIFQEFTQADQSHEKKFGGSGLGLFISWKLAGLLDGALKLRSKSGEGSTFTLELPAKFSEAPAASEKEILPAGDLAFKRVIIVDDDTLLLQMLEDWLVTRKAIVHAFKSATEVLAQIDKINFDLIITDIQLPGINGFRFLELLRSDPSYGYKGQPVIAVSGRKDLDAEKYLINGFSAFVFKPYKPSDLLEVISGLEERKQPEEEHHGERQTDRQTPPLYDLDDLKSFMDNDEKALQQLLDSFMQTTEDDLESMKAFRSKGDVHAIQDLAHRMKTMFRQIHAESMVKVLEKIELETTSDMTEISGWIADLEKAFQTLQESITNQKT
ncbi:ATP-binding protein [Robertkochia flava]|uniref:ATP-binding protein n=1 Tax=Robertkochia flava TaxID=3447986 RepID=UPI001CCC6DAD|nr:ATP-binding protein [Robertkochia marina]